MKALHDSHPTRRLELLIYCFIIFIGVISIVGVYYNAVPTPRVDQMDVEYHLEILNQDSVLVRNADTGRIYKAHIDSIQAVLLEDNL